MSDLLARPEPWIVVVYLGLMVTIGVRFARRMEGGEDYFAGGRRIPWWTSGISLYMANFSAWLFTGGAGIIYRTTWFGLLYFFVTLSLGYLLGSQLTAVQWRRSRVISPVEYTRERFGVGTQQLLSVVYSVVFIASAGAQLLAISTIVHGILGVPIPAAILAVGVVVLLYTLLGGIWAVAVTDVVQFVILIAVAVVVAPLAVGLLPGGLFQLLGGLDPLTFPLPHAQPGEDLHLLLGGLVSFTLGTAAGQAPRFYSVPDEKDALRVGRLAAALFLTVPLLFSIPPLVARLHLPVGPEGLDRFLGAANAHELVYVHIVREVFPPALVGVFLAAMFAATMSALDSYYNQVASMLSRDVWGGLLRPETDDRELLRVGWVATLVVGLLVVGLAFYYHAGIESDLFTISTTILFIAAPAINVPIVLGLLFRPAPRGAAAASIAWGAVMGLTTRLALGWSYGPQTYVTLAAATAIFLAAPALGRLWRSRGGPLWSLGLGGVVGSVVLWALRTGTADGRFWRAGPIHIAGESIAALVAAAFALSLVAFARWFARSEDRTAVAAFYRRLDTPVDVAAEVTKVRSSALEVFRLVGGLALLVAGLVALLAGADLLLTPVDRLAWGRYLALVAVLAVLGLLFRWAGRRGAGGAAASG